MAAWARELSVTALLVTAFVETLCQKTVMVLPQNIATLSLIRHKDLAKPFLLACCLTLRLRLWFRPVSKARCRLGELFHQYVQQTRAAVPD